MGSLGWPEMVFIFVLALVLFGPKELPKIGRTLGKAMTEFRRAQNELKATIDREMKNLEQDADLKELKQITSEYHYDTYNYDYSSYEGSNYEGTYGSEPYDSAATTPTTAGASATEGAESPSAAKPAEETAAVLHPATNPHSEGTNPASGLEAAGNGHAAPAPAATEHKA